MKSWNTVAIVGVGLIGGSIGLALRRRGLARSVVGVGRRASSLRKARRYGTVTSTTTNLARGVAAAELVVVCTPVGLIAKHVREASAHCPPGALITDAGSTKAEIVAALRGDLGRDVAFVGSHPLAGSEKTGPEFAKEDLLEGRVVVVTPTRTTGRDRYAAVATFWSQLGARVIRMTPSDHDRALAATSHLPHLVASVLAASTSNGDLRLVASGWRDTTRIAAGDVQLWRQIFSGNRGHLLKSLGKFEKSLASFRAALERDDPVAIEKFLAMGKQTRDAVGS